MSSYGKLVNSKNQFNVVIIMIMVIIKIKFYLKVTNMPHVILKIIQYTMMIKYYNNLYRL